MLSMSLIPFGWFPGKALLALIHQRCIVRSELGNTGDPLFSSVQSKILVSDGVTKARVEPWVNKCILTIKRIIILPSECSFYERLPDVGVELEIMTMEPAAKRRVILL